MGMRRWKVGLLVMGITSMVACTGVTETRLAAKPGRAPIGTLFVVIDKDTIGSAFASYRGTVPFGSKTGDYQGFIDNLVAGCQAEAKASGVEATVEVLSLKALPAGQALPTRGNPVLTIRATSFTTRKEAIGGKDLGWSGDSAWEFSLSERTPTTPYSRTWVAGVKNENLNPTLCGNYSSCSTALANKVFTQMRKDGVVR